jgi:SAM-dependent methyltransferase
MDTEEAVTKQCPVCRSASSPALSKDGCAYFECSRCEFLFYRLDPIGADTVSPALYDRHYWEMEHVEALRRENEDGFIRALELLYLSTRSVETILDFGCGLGITVQLLRDKLELNAVGVDVSADFVENEFLHRCDLETLSRRYPPGHFDAIYSVEVFEHLDDPGRILALLGALLKPDGKILINTGTREFMNKYDPELAYVDPLHRGHISIYSLKSFSRLAAAIGRRAEFLGDRKYEVILSPLTEPAPHPHPENMERIRRLGEWYPSFLGEYMRLIDVEREFDVMGQWIPRLQDEVETLRAAKWGFGYRLAKSMKRFCLKVWKRATGRFEL